MKLTGPRFVLNIRAIREEYPDMPEQTDGNVVLWDRLKRRPVMTLHREYANAICLEHTSTPGSAPFTAMEAWFNNTSAEAFASEGIE